MEGRYQEWKGDIEGGREISRVEGRYRGYQLTVTNGCRYCDSDSVAMVTKSMSRRGESTGGRERP